MAKVQANGWAMTFGTSSWNPKITSFSRSGEAADDIESSDLSTVGFKTYLGGALIEGGTITCGYQFDPVLTTRPVTGVSETITLVYPISISGNSAETDVFTGYINSYENEGENNNLITGTFVLKVADDIAVTEEV